MRAGKPKTSRCGDRWTAAAFCACEPPRMPRMPSVLRPVRGAVVLCLLLLLGACATPFHRPDPLDEAALRHRAKTAAGEGVRVSATIPSPEESRAIFGVDLEEKGVQPLWLEIENDTDRPLLFSPTGLDPWYFSPLEVSFAYHKRFSDDANAQLDEHIRGLAHKLVVGPRSTESGFVYTNRDEVNKFVSVDLVGRKWAQAVNLIVPTEGTTSPEERYRQLSQVIAQSGVVETDDESHLRELLEQLPCCVTSRNGTQVEPLNLVLIGQITDVGPAFIRRGYRVTPADNRYLFGRPQDFSASKRDLWVAAQPHLFRAWLTPIRFRGIPVWVAQVSSPLGGRFARPAEDGAPLPIDPNVDEARNDLVQDIVYSQFLARIGFVQGVGQVKASAPRTIPGVGSYHTDGLRAVLFIEERPFHLSEIGFLDWERLVDHYRKQVDGGESSKPGP
ncbi:MAG TPA: hypothetical protein DEH27_00480 [Deltaproteobacteria bacterium]|nr:hypothetical protein [Deltaproteobacteria bacterium]